jgi:alpha/beta superfamily hydrolase
MLPIYFGDPARALFGIYHPARRARSLPMSAVLCHPIGNEFVGAYRTMRVLADQLCEAGVSVLRFDYYGTGDSAGFAQDASAEEWLKDIDHAIEEIKGAAATEKTILIGVRLGATLAMLSAQAREDIERVVLWEPIMHGRDHIDEHLARHREWLKLGRCRVEDSTDNEALGYPFTDELIGSISNLDLETLDSIEISKILLLFHSKESEQRGRALQRLAHQAESRVITSPDFWLGRTAFDHPLVSPENVASIVGWLNGDAA